MGAGDAAAGLFDWGIADSGTGVGGTVALVSAEASGKMPSCMGGVSVDAADITASVLGASAAG
ncbi:hypothetical protein HC776_02520 [bacterium]|nr:hypothetical protein [bacterium]